MSELSRVYPRPCGCPFPCLNLLMAIRVHPRQRGVPVDASHHDVGSSVRTREARHPELKLVNQDGVQPHARGIPFSFEEFLRELPGLSAPSRGARHGHHHLLQCHRFIRARTGGPSLRLCDVRNTEFIRTHAGCSCQDMRHSK